MKRKIVAILSVIAVSLMIYALPVLGAGEGGTSFADTVAAGKENAAAKAQELKAAGETSSVKIKGGLMALTFDDGPSANTEKLLDELKARNIKATFFVVGERIEEFSDLIKREYDEGHEIANHTYTHFTLTGGDAATINDQVNRTNEAISNVIGTDIGKTLLRPPGGSANEAVCAAVDVPLILWSVDTLDWKSRNADAVASRIRAQAADGAIILMHDLYDTSVDGCVATLDELMDEGYTFVTVSELFRRKGETLEAGKIYMNAEYNGVDLGPLSAEEQAAMKNGAAAPAADSADTEETKDQTKTEETAKDSAKTGENDEEEGFPWAYLIFCGCVIIVSAVGIVRHLGRNGTAAAARTAGNRNRSRFDVRAGKERSNEKNTAHNRTRGRAGSNRNRRSAAQRRRR